MENPHTSSHPTPMIGVFDSGVGGLSVLRELWQELPDSPIIYLADQAHVPYGSRSLNQVRTYAEAIARYLLRSGVKLIVVACNTASAAALYALRETFPEIPFVGMEPAVKPAAEQTHSGVVGVLATPATFQGALYNSVVERFASHVRLVQDTCPGLVSQIEAGKLSDPDTVAILQHALKPMLVAGIDTVVLGCTHYPFVIPAIQELVGEAVRVIDPAPAIARQTRRVLAMHGWLPDSSATPIPPTERTQFLTSGDTEVFEARLKALLNVQAKAGSLRWQEDDHTLSASS